MRQEINFYRGDVCPVKSALSAERMAGWLLLALLVFILVSIVQLAINQRTISRISVSQKQISLLAERVRQMQLSHPDKPDQSLLAEINKVQGRIDGLNRLLQAVYGEEQIRREGFAVYFEGLARRIPPDVWLTGIRLDGGGGGIKLDGCALNKGAGISELVQNLKLENAFKSKPFSHFRIKPPVLESCQLEFVLSTHGLEPEKIDRH
ncbi:MAG: PilN domain-containing protein [Methylococcaceae bacterium]|nr:PilN domain-containing protein [Methylococcaceae bacterium]